MTRVYWLYETPEGKTLALGQTYDSRGEGGVFHIATSRELARYWARELGAGRSPSNAEPDSEPLRRAAARS